MLIEIIIALTIGIIAGTITGLIPGIHTNLIGAILISMITSFYFNPTYTITFITSMAITHTFIDFIPTTFLGCSDTTTELGILPSHELLKSKRGFEAVNLANKGSLIAIILTIIILPISIFILKPTYSTIEKLIPYLLIIISILLISKEKNKILSLFIFLLTGLLGYSINQIENLTQPLLPLLTGLFGASNIFLSLNNKTKIPKQIITKSKIEMNQPIISSLISAPICSFLPGIGSSQAAIIGNTIKRNSKKQFLVLIGITNTFVMSFSLITLFLINKTRTGAAITINEILPTATTNYLILIIIITTITGIFAFHLTNKIARIIALNFNKINYKFLSYITLALLTIIVLIISKTTGLLILAISTLTGIYTIKKGIRRTNMMGCLIIPTIIWLI